MSKMWDRVLAKRGVKPSDDRRPAGDTEAAIRERVVAEERERALGIVAACEVAGASARAAGFITEGKTVSEVVATLGSGRTRPRG
jgi:hypothetical protein